MIEIRSTAELGKSLSVRREKDGDDEGTDEVGRWKVRTAA
jgi:hypothetical protein